jgi:hypothetical protein
LIKKNESIEDFKISRTEKGILITNMKSEIKSETKPKWVIEYGCGGKILKVLKNEAANS